MTDNDDYEDEWDLDVPEKAMKAKNPPDDDPFEFATSKEVVARADAPVQASRSDKPAATPAKSMSFKETFAAQRKAGASTFEWNGKKFTTALKSEAPEVAAANPATTVTKSSSPMRG